MTALAWDLPTPLGVYAAGLPVIVLARSRLRVKICLDSVHLSGRCHSVFVTTDSIREDDDADQAREPAPLSAGLAGPRVGVEGRRWLAL